VVAVKKVGQKEVELWLLVKKKEELYQVKDDSVRNIHSDRREIRALRI
jgi:hypothetical protein